MPVAAQPGPHHATRRTVLAGAAVGAATVALLPEDAYAAALPERARWEKMVGRTFVATRAGRRIKLRVEAVENAAYRPPGLSPRARRRWRSQAYVVRFSTGGRPEQGTWTLRHPRTGRLRVFVVAAPHRPGRRTGVSASFNGWRG